MSRPSFEAARRVAYHPTKDGSRLGLWWVPDWMPTDALSTCRGERFVRQLGFALETSSVVESRVFR